jgi:alanyl-tRNA synthetase
MVFAVRDLMQDAYPELNENADRVSKVVLAEETRFAHTMDVGLKRLEEQLEPLSQRKKDEPGAAVVYSGINAFQLYDTFGLPLDFIEDAVRDRGLDFAADIFKMAMEQQRERARASWKGAAKQTANPAYQQLPKSDFEGYRQTRSDNCEVLAIIKGQSRRAGTKARRVRRDHSRSHSLLRRIRRPGRRSWMALLRRSQHCRRRSDRMLLPGPGRARTSGFRQAGDPRGQKVDAVVDTAIRESTMRNHTATHLLQAGLREVLGKHVKQAGSLVAPNHLRFDFSHFTGVAEEELQDIEDIINKEVLRNEKVEIIERCPD